MARSHNSSHSYPVVSRRGFLGASGLGLGGALLAPSVLAGCGSDGKKSATSTACTDLKLGTGADKVTISTWDAYIDVDASGDPEYSGGTLDRFQSSSGVDAQWKVDYNDNDEYYNKIFSPQLSKCRPISPDIVMPTQWMAARLMSLGWLAPLPLDRIPNHANLDDQYLDLAWDPGAEHFMVWQGGIAGIAYNRKLTGRDLGGFDDLLDSRYKGKVGMLTEMRDTVGLAMLAAGDDPSKVDLDAIDSAMDTIEKAKADGQIRSFTGNEYLASLESGDFVACVAWSGDIAQLGNDDIRFVIPEAGGTLWFDTMVMPVGARNSVAAAEFMDFVYDPEVAAEITKYVGYISPVKGVREELEREGGEAAKLAENPLIFPDDETRERLHIFAGLPVEEELALQKRFNGIIGA